MLRMLGDALRRARHWRSSPCPAICRDPTAAPSAAGRGTAAACNRRSDSTMRIRKSTIGQRRNAAHALAEVLGARRRLQQRLVIALGKKMIEGVDVAHGFSCLPLPLWERLGSRRGADGRSAHRLQSDRHRTPHEGREHRSAQHRISHGDRERVGVAVEIADHLQAERHGVDLEQRQRQRRHAEERSRHGEFRIAGRGESLRRAARRGERDAGVAGRRERGMDGAHARAFLQIGAMLGERQILVFLGALHDDCGSICRRRGRA